MSVHVREEQRRLLPRWRESAVASNTAELLPLPVAAEPPRPVDRRPVEESLADWRAAPSVATAADAVAAGFVLGAVDLVQEPAEFLMANADQAGAPALALARRIMGQEVVRADPQARATVASRTINHRTAVAVLRARLIRTPRDPLAYLDLARRYAALGQMDRATGALRAALALAPDSRFVLRSASRFYVHARDAEHAHDLLRRSPRTRTDPWLVAAEISAATVAARTSRLIKTGRDLVARRSLPAVHLSELAGALGTLELGEGNNKAARKLFAQAMSDPTDNALAQAQWALPKLGLTGLPDVESVPRAYEADALAALREGDWPRALSAAYSWLDDEPFSHKSATLGSFVASTGLGDYGEAAVIATEGLTANPSDQLLRNNLVFSLANDGQIERAVREAQLADVSAMDLDTRICWTATVGLLNYRLDNLQFGRDHYRAALEAAERQGKGVMAAMAALHWALAALESGDEQAAMIREEALARADRFPVPPVSALRARLMAAVDSSAPPPPRRENPSER